MNDLPRFLPSAVWPRQTSRTARLRWALGGLGALALSACAMEPAQPLRVQMATLIGEARCTADAQCHTVAVGARACGGPAAFLAWSSAGPDAATLRSRLPALSVASAEDDRREQRASGRVGTCQVLTDPGARCDTERQRCVLGAGAADPR